MGCVRLSGVARKTLAELGKRLGKQALKEVTSIIKYYDGEAAWRVYSTAREAATHRKETDRCLP